MSSNNKLMDRVLLIVLCLSAVLVSGCAARSIHAINFVPEIGPSSTSEYDLSINYVMVSIAPIAEQLGDVECDASIPHLWKSAIEEALARSRFFSIDSTRRGDIFVKILEYDIPLFGLDMTSQTVANYQIVDCKTGEILFDETISTKATVPTSFDYVGANRVIESVNRAVRQNIDEFFVSLRRLHK